MNLACAMLSLFLCTVVAVSAAFNEVGRLDEAYHPGTEPSPVVSTNSGPVEGLVQKALDGTDFYAFYGIPYARPPVGPYRFQPPAPVTEWTGVFEAVDNDTSCAQYDIFKDESAGTENCLKLNVYTRELYASRPVMVSIHSGGFASGSSNPNLYDPRILMSREIVLVTINYRVGIFGFLSTEDEVVPGNMGLKDQVMALRWIADNAESFGGDPNSITIFGTSVGGVSAHLHMLSPLSKGLFHSVISQSGVAINDIYVDRNASAKARALAQMLECPTDNSSALVDCLQEKDYNQLLNTFTKFYEWRQFPLVLFGPVIEKAGNNSFLSDHPKELLRRGEYAQVPFITGVNENEGSFIAADILERPDVLESLNVNWTTVAPIIYAYQQYDQRNEISSNIRQFYFRNANVTKKAAKDLINSLTDRYFNYPMYSAVKLMTSHNTTPVFVYQLTFHSRFSIPRFAVSPITMDYGVSHGDDLQYLFRGAMSGMYTSHRFAAEYDMSCFMKMLWTNFARTGIPEPDDEGQITRLSWQSAVPDEMRFLNLKMPSIMQKEKHFPVKRMQFWDEQLKY